MIYEQAVHSLPEVLAGTGYPSQDHEGGIVAAFSMAVLQELNARNLQNPLSAIQCERLYRKKAKAWKSAKKGGKPRYLRADLVVNLHNMKVANSAMSAYGWRHANWLEAKFFRSYHQQTGLPKINDNQSQHTGSLLADLFRILALTPRGVPQKIQSNRNEVNRSNVGRYLLHVYSGKIDQHLSLKTSKGSLRDWIQALTTPGQQHVSGLTVSSEPQTIRKHVGHGLESLEIDFTSTNFVIEPAHDQKKIVTHTCILSRIDSFSLKIDKNRWGVSEDRTIQSSQTDDRIDFNEVSNFVGARIELKGEKETMKPIPTGISDDMDDDLI